MRRTPGQRKLSLAGFKTAAKLGPEGCDRRARRAALARFHPAQYAALKAREEEIERQECEKARARMKELLSSEAARLDVPTRATLEFAQTLNVAIVARENGTLYLSDNAKKLPCRVCESLKNDIGLRYHEIWNLLASGSPGSLLHVSADHA
jgi:hypothetical protein